MTASPRPAPAPGLARPRPDSPAGPFGHVMIVEDHPLFSDALSITLQSLCEVTEVTHADCLETALARLDEGLAPDIVLLDLHLPDVKGFDGLMRLKRALGPVPVLIVSSLADDRTVAAALGAGATGYVPKHSQRAVFAEAFDAIAQGRSFLPEGFVMPGPASGEDDRERMLRRLSSLTPQQARILSLICDGKLNKQIAYELSIAEATVKAHVTAIMRKLGVQSRTQAVLVARDARFDTLAG